MKLLNKLKTYIQKKVIDILYLALLFPIKITIKSINIIRASKNNDFLDEFICKFRSKIQNEFSQITDSSYLVKHFAPESVPLVYIDIGARDGLPDIISKNLGSFNKIIMCEGEPKEAKMLRDNGYLVIDKFLSDMEGEAKFYYNKGHVGSSSLKPPGSLFLHLFTNKHYQVYTDVIEKDVVTSTLDIELKKLRINSIDFIKIDVQGSELSIIEGFTSVSPLFWEIEVLQLPTYQETPYGVSITKELTSRGYLCFRQNGRFCRDGIFLFSNELYMPDYTTDFGRTLILENIERWRVMIELFDVKALGNHIEAIINPAQDTSAIHMFKSK
jgi:FkbM family methyltransferase